MLIYLVKVLISATLLVIAADVAKRQPLIGAIIASIPLVSVLAISWLYWDTKSIDVVMALSRGIFWMVLPSLVFFITLPLFLRMKIAFVWSMSLALILMLLSYFVMVMALKVFGIRI